MTKPMSKWQPNTLRQLANKGLHLLLILLIKFLLELQMPNIRLVLIVFQSRRAFLDLIADFVESCWTGGTVDIVVFVEPVPEHAARGLDSSDLDAFAAPAFFSVWEVNKYQIQ